ncbi:ABC transporter [Lactococcus hodotermopsidis]|uniref:ABC transporter n=1 Tax=Pseudolactococcus hodotermopsidis TaxID=2709157 RepID=A0A6A0BF62_9LACT|nr:ATP-binding cassette domain-containing protein [Lactococcus hodotermopsidis]GFH43416.1 ABC transporter [Lactococcus hodotermopsidis]
MTETVLTLKNVTKKFGSQLALDNVSLDVKKGDIYGLIGRNGSGKTTIMKIITDLSQATSGSVTLLGASKNTAQYVQSLGRIGAVIESPAAYNKLTAYQNMKVICLQRGIHDYSLIDDMLQFVNLADTGKKKFKQFSLGMKQRLGIAMALIGQPDFLILDEPINGLDPFAIIEFRELIQKINRERNTTILISSHILTELYQVSTCFGFIHNGKMVQEISKDDFDALVVDSILLNVDNAELATVILRENFEATFQVTSDHDIKITNTTLTVAEVNKVLAQNAIGINSIGKQENTLEDYYTNLVKEIEGE